MSTEVAEALKSSRTTKKVLARTMADDATETATWAAVLGTAVSWLEVHPVMR